MEGKHSKGRWFRPDTWRGEMPIYCKPTVGRRILICTIASLPSDRDDEEESANGGLIAAAPIGAELAELVLEQESLRLSVQGGEDIEAGLKRWDAIVALAREFQGKAGGK